jgi:hypothetical protein
MEYCKPQDLISFLITSGLVLDQEQRSLFMKHQHVQALLQKLSSLLSDRQVLASLSPIKLIEAVKVFSRLGVSLPTHASTAHAEAASHVVLLMGNTLRASLREQYAQLGILQDAVNVHVELAQALMGPQADNLGVQRLKSG